MQFNITKIIIVVTIAVFGSCKTQHLLMEPRAERDNSPAALDSVFLFDANYEYRIRKDDKVSISVWGQDELSVGSLYGIYNSNEVYGKWLLVDAGGNIELPKLGTMNVLNKTVIEVKQILKGKLSKWIVNPIVDVRVLNKQITVLGEVRDPKVIQVDKDNNTLLEVIAKCSGFDSYANLKYVKILRQAGEDVYIANINLTRSGQYFSRNIQVHPGDIVIVPSKSHKEFDKRVSTIIPFTTTITAAAILMGAL
ncbi:hypothetical protein GCM10009122_09010 [Fulvivirga kasyanovii]|uniref:Polysaccharide export protein n=1 Tax=Fulvivirga kasyanovii TaxID=396812 RepID=A0ABW9RXV1_9BACT|nr:polysaccharide biosynthesis/export family protein [Fulvivirga kasyanovii]MTI29092.1 polysaccharide export protein [Fulvivirga kasyanovii]